MIHPDTELRHVNGDIGLGVFATRRLPRGTIVWVLDQLDQRLPPERVRQLSPPYGALLERYGYLNAAGECVLCWDLARWINHSCEANVLSSGWEFDVAIRDIAAGEELTNEYGALNLRRSFRCHCRAPACRETVYPTDFERLADAWDGRVRQAFPELDRVPQPLWEWVQSKRSVSAALREPSLLPSIRRHRLLGEAPVARRQRVAGRSR